MDHFRQLILSPTITVYDAAIIKAADKLPILDLEDACVAVLQRWPRHGGTFSTVYRMLVLRARRMPLFKLARHFFKLGWCGGDLMGDLMTTTTSRHFGWLLARTSTMAQQQRDEAALWFSEPADVTSHAFQALYAELHDAHDLVALRDLCRVSFLTAVAERLDKLTFDRFAPMKRSEFRRLLCAGRIGTRELGERVIPHLKGIHRGDILRPLSRPEDWPVFDALSTMLHGQFYVRTTKVWLEPGGAHDVDANLHEMERASRERYRDVITAAVRCSPGLAGLVVGLLL